MAYQTLGDIEWLRYPWRRAAVVTDSCEEKGFHTFPNSFSSKVSVTAGVEFELAYYEVTVLYVNYAVMQTTQKLELSFCFILSVNHEFLILSLSFQAWHYNLFCH